MHTIIFIPLLNVLLKRISLKVLNEVVLSYFVMIQTKLKITMKKAIIFSFIIISRVRLFAQFEPEQDNKYKWQITAVLNSVEAQMDQKLFDTWTYASANYYGYYGDKEDNSFSWSIIPKYLITDNTFLRLEFGVTNINLHMRYNGSGDTASLNQGQVGGTGNITKHDIITQKISRYVAGIQWNFMKKKYIEAYCGGTLNYLHYSEMEWIDYIDALYLPGRKTNYRATTPGGFATGIGAFLGFNICIHKNVSIGGEFSYSLL